MTRFIEEDNRSQATLFPEQLDEYIAEDNPVRVIDAFVDGLDLRDLKFERAVPKATSPNCTESDASHNHGRGALGL